MLKKNKDFYIRLNVLKYEIKFLLLKFLFYNNNTSTFEKHIIVNLFCYYSKLFIFRSKIKNRSIYSKESNSVIRKFKLSRWELKKFASVGKSRVSGLKKSSW